MLLWLANLGLAGSEAAATVHVLTATDVESSSEVSSPVLTHEYPMISEGDITGEELIMSTDIEICNIALLRLGNDLITSFTDGDKGLTCSKVYPSVKKMLLSIHPWRFATGKRQLARLTAAPVNEWKYAFQLPSDLIAGPHAGYITTDEAATPSKEWKIFEDKIYANSDVFVIDYRYEVTEGRMPAWFQTLIELALCAALAPQLAGDENGTMVTEYNERAFGPRSDNMQGGYFAVCKAINGRTSPNTRIVADDIVNARFG